MALHWLKGLLCLARGDDDAALAAFERELALESRGHLYARECCANAWCAIGACHLRLRDHASARAAFKQAIARVPTLAMAHAGIALLDPKRPRRLAAEPASVDEAVTQAALLVANAESAAAAQTILTALAAAPPGNAGWRIPVEPLLHVNRDQPALNQVLGLVRQRAV